jgi:hypothetical protein
MIHIGEMRIWSVLLICSCGAPQEPPPKPLPQPLPPPPPSATVSAAPSISAAPLPSALAPPYGVESRTQTTVAPAKGTAAVSCRTLDGTLADEVVPPNWAKLFQSCKPPAGSRFVIRIEAAVRSRTAKGTIDREVADENIAKCVSGILVKSASNLLPDDSDRPQLWDCYVAFY